MVAPWMENGNIVDYVREEPQVNPLKLARNMFHFTQRSIDPATVGGGYTRSSVSPQCGSSSW